MSALRSSTLRLRTAAMKLPKWPLARPAPRVDLGNLRQRHGLLLPLGIELVLPAIVPAFEMDDVADLLAVVRRRSCRPRTSKMSCVSP